MGKIAAASALRQEPSGEKFTCQRTRILALLRDRGTAGATNSELNAICFRYGARIWELRRAGRHIRTENRGDGVFAFILEARPEVPSDYLRRTLKIQAETMPLFAEVAHA